VQRKALAGAYFCPEGCRQRTTGQLSEPFSSHRQVTDVRSNPGAFSLMAMKASLERYLHDLLKPQSPVFQAPANPGDPHGPFEA